MRPNFDGKFDDNVDDISTSTNQRKKRKKDKGKKGKASINYGDKKDRKNPQGSGACCGSGNEQCSIF